MPTLITLLFRLLTLAAGLVLATSLLVVTFVAGAFWALQAGWGRLTGKQPLQTLRSSLRRGTGFGWAARRPQPAYIPRNAPRHARVRDVTDVRPK